jgi:hypothetical protein
LTYETPTNWGVTEDSGGFDYFPGEEVELWVGTVFLGKALAGQKISPLDIFLSENVDTDEALQDTRVVNMARLLQSLDFDGEPKGGIGITPTVRGCLDMAAENLGLLDFTTGESIVNFADSTAVQVLIDEALVQCAGAPNVSLVEVSAAEAAANLEAGLNASGIFRKNVSKTEDWGETKQKLEVMPVYFPGMRSQSLALLGRRRRQDLRRARWGHARRALRGVAP